MAKHFIVAAIDFGTTYSGYAYSFKDSYETDPLKIFSNTWTDGCGALTLKQPTCALFDENGEFHSFGYEAEDKYAKLASSDKHIGWKYFRHFKMSLHNKPNLSLKRTKLRDDQGKLMKAIEVFAASIKYLKDHLIHKLTESSRVHEPSVNDKQSQMAGILTNDILWVLTVPAIWSDSAKQFMRKAAEQAGIQEGQLVLSLEPEAAAIFAKTSVLSSNDRENRIAFKHNSQFMVIDLGGGTVDITVHKVNQDGKLHEVYPPSGGPWGGTLVDEHIYNFLEDIFGRTVLEILKQESCTEMLDMVRTLELKKRQFKSTSDDEGKVNLTLPSSLFEIYQEENKTEDITDKLKRMFPKHEVTKKRGRLIIDKEIFSNMFKESIDSLTDNIKAIFNRPDMESINTLVLVGGYSECEILKTTIRETFGDKRVIIPEEAVTAVVKGAVLFGHDQRVIDSRRSPCTYGVSIAVPFDPQRHPPMHRYKDMCEDVFQVFIHIGEKIEPGKTQITHSFNTSESCTCVEIYKSISEKPAFITDSGCERLGVIDLRQLPVDLRQLPERATRVDIIMKFGDTELHVEAKEHGTENKVGAQFNFLR